MKYAAQRPKSTTKRKKPYPEILDICTPLELRPSAKVGHGLGDGDFGCKPDSNFYEDLDAVKCLVLFEKGQATGRNRCQPLNWAENEHTL